MVCVCVYVCTSYHIFICVVSLFSGELTLDFIADVSSSFQFAVTRHLGMRTHRALQYCSLRHPDVKHMVCTPMYLSGWSGVILVDTGVCPNVPVCTYVQVCVSAFIWMNIWLVDFTLLFKLIK